MGLLYKLVTLGGLWASLGWGGAGVMGDGGRGWDRGMGLFQEFFRCELTHTF